MSIFLNGIYESDDLISDLDDTTTDDELALDSDLGSELAPAEDPLEEASMVMYESQYNFNQIMMAIGMRELNEAARGKVAVFTEADVSGFFTKVKDTIKRMFQRIQTAINEFLIDFGGKVRKDEDFVHRYANEIRVGYKTDNWSLEGYAYNTKAAEMLDDYDKASAAMLAQAGDVSASDFDDNKTIDVKQIKNDFLMKVADGNSKAAKSISSAVDELIKNTRGSDSPISLTTKNVNIDDVIGTLTGFEFKSAKNAIRRIRDSYKKAIDKINKLEKNVKGDKSISNKSTILKNISKTSDLIIFERNVCNSVYLAYLRCLRDKTNQCRKIAHKCYQLGKNASGEKKYDNKYGSQNASALFNIDLI